MANMTSDKQRRANRKNAQKSTGPKTDKGKKAVRYNAAKHSILSKEVLIRDGEGKESEDEFNTLFADLSEELKPEGALERILTERVVICVWRLKRVLRAEVGEIRKGQDAVLFRSLIDYWDPTKADGDLESPTESGQFDRVFKSLRYIVHGLERDRDEAVRLTDNETDKKKIRELFGGRIKEFEGWMELIEHNKALEIEANLLSRSLPSKDTVEKILRYETAIERQLYRALSELERLQRRRRGE